MFFAALVILTGKMLKLGRIGVLSSQLYQPGIIVQDKLRTRNVNNLLRVMERALVAYLF